MATKAKKKKAGKKKEHDSPARITEAYEKAVGAYSEAVDLLRRKQYDKAEQAFTKLIQEHPDEMEMSERSRTYIEICRRRQAAAPEEPKSAQDRYYRAIMLANEHRFNDAIVLLDLAINEKPKDATMYYARACANALQGNSQATVDDLKQAIHLEPTLRFQAINDPDFEKVRDDAAFIDLIEPTVPGV